MPKPGDDPHKFVAQVSLVGRSHGLVKTLGGFRKQHHTVPDAVNATTTAFLAKLCGPELAEEGERFYQTARAALGYKRTELSLEIAGAMARLVTKDFNLEIGYALEKSDPASYVVVRTLRSLRRMECAEREEFDQLFAGVFSGIVFALRKGVRVEDVIDAVEALEEDSELTVSYPSDCRACTLMVEGVRAAVICDGGTLEMQFPRNGSPRELMAAFIAVRSAFALTKNRVLAGLL
jgi:hypothetical protein